jgi:hypothetical protein
MLTRARILSIFLAAFLATTLQASWIGAARAQQVPGREDSDAEVHPRFEGHRARGRDWAERLRRATPELREARRERMLERLRTASPAERQRVLRRERRIMRFLPEEERRAIRREKRKFAEEHGIAGPHEGEGWEALWELDFPPAERRVLRHRFRQLSREERHELRRKILNMRELPEAERRLLRERLHEMKSLSEDEKQAFHERTRRWSEMSEEKREKLRAQMRRLRALPPDERLELLERAQKASESDAN